MEASKWRPHDGMHAFGWCAFGASLITPDHDKMMQSFFHFSDPISLFSVVHGLGNTIPHATTNYSQPLIKNWLWVRLYLIAQFYQSLHQSSAPWLRWQSTCICARITTIPQINIKSPTITNQSKICNFNQFQNDKYTECQPTKSITALVFSPWRMKCLSR